MKKALIVMDNYAAEGVYTKHALQKITNHFELLAEPLSADEVLNHPELLEKTEVLFSGWGAPKFDAAFLKKTPYLEAIFYAAGTMKELLTENVWNREIVVSTANAINAIPVAEYTLSQILFSLKNGWPITRQVKKNRQYHIGEFEPLGSYQRTVGLISLSEVGKKTLEFLKPFDIHVVFYDPFISEKEGLTLGATKVSLDEVFTLSDVVSLHTPLLPETIGLIKGKHFRKMKINSTFINTARGAIVKENELIEVLKERDDITAILDVTIKEPLEKESELYDLENSVLTPHIAGSTGTETNRLGDVMVEEAIRYSNNELLKFEITQQSYTKMA